MSFNPFTPRAGVTSISANNISSPRDSLGFWISCHGFRIQEYCIGHFPVPKTLTFKMRLGAQPFLWKWVLFAWEWKMISISKAEHLPSFWNRGRGKSEMAIPNSVSGTWIPDWILDSNRLSCISDSKAQVFRFYKPKFAQIPDSTRGESMHNQDSRLQRMKWSQRGKCFYLRSNFLN